MVSRLAELLGKHESYFALGERLGTHEENVRRYLNGSVNPSVEVLATVAVEYGCSLDWLVLGKGKRGR